jgi:adenylate kinase family enzyme
MSSVRLQRAAFPGRISIIGVPGAGKTSLARAILNARPAPHINADAYIWDPNWTLRGPDPNAEFQAALKRKRAWIADACVVHGPKELLELPDLVIYLDYSAPRLVLHNLKRWLVHRRTRRAELPAGCEERFPLAILRGVLRGGYRRLHEEALTTYPPRRLVRISSPRELRAFVEAHLAPAAPK